MSYSATVALVAVFEALTRTRRLWPVRGRAAPILAPVLALVISSATAGLATAPFGAAYFGRVSSYGLLANLLAMPVMALVEMPGAVLAGLLAPLGLQVPVLWVVGQGARWILGVAHFVAHLNGAAVPVAAPPALVLPLLALGALWLVLWRGLPRLAGIAAVGLALAVWAMAARPALLIADSGALVGLMTPAGRALSKPIEGFTAHSWLQADGDGAGSRAAAARPGFAGPGRARRFALAGLKAVVLTGKAAPAALPSACGGARIVVTTAKAGKAAPPGGCRLIDQRLLRRSGALAVWRRGNRLVFVAARAVQGDRLWTRAGHRYPLHPPRLAPLALPDGASGPKPARLAAAR
jgi:competence protein ComEC